MTTESDEAKGPCIHGGHLHRFLPVKVSPPWLSGRRRCDCTPIEEERDWLVRHMSPASQLKWIGSRREDRSY